MTRRVRALVAWVAPALLAAPLAPAAAAPRPAPEILRVNAPLWSSGVAGAIAAPLRERRACGTPAVATADAEAVAATLRRWTEEHVSAPRGGAIPVVFHLITAPGQDPVADARVEAQLRELNRAFAGAGYRFELAGVVRREEPEWLGMTPGSAKERNARRVLARDPARVLNIYVTRLGEGHGGWASYPWSAPEGDEVHGVVLDVSALPGGAPAAETGPAAVHLVAHYLGLPHGSERGLDLEPAGAPFDGAAIERMRAATSLYRPSLLSRPASRVAGRPEISPAEGAEPEEGRVLSYRGAFPNPFRAETALRFTLPSSQPVSLRIYSVTGQLVRTLVEAPLPPGDHSAMFRAEGLPSGAYFAVLRVGSVRMSRTLMLVR
jgi:hypothetical protein